MGEGSPVPRSLSWARKGDEAELSVCVWGDYSWKTGAWGCLVISYSRSYS